MQGVDIALRQFFDQVVVCIVEFNGAAADDVEVAAVDILWREVAVAAQVADLQGFGELLQGSDRRVRRTDGVRRESRGSRSVRFPWDQFQLSIG